MLLATLCCIYVALLCSVSVSCVLLASIQKWLLVPSSYYKFSCRKATSENYEPERTIIDENNLPDRLFQSLKANISPRKTYRYNFESNTFCFNRTNSHLILRLNICSLQAYFDHLLDFLQEFSSLPSIIFISKLVSTITL